MSKQKAVKKPEHCKGCILWNRGAHGRYLSWCCQFSTVAKNAVSICKIQGGKNESQGDE